MLDRWFQFGEPHHTNICMQTTTCCYTAGRCTREQIHSHTDTTCRFESNLWEACFAKFPQTEFISRVNLANQCCRRLEQHQAKRASYLYAGCIFAVVYSRSCKGCRVVNLLGTHHTHLFEYKVIGGRIKGGGFVPFCWVWANRIFANSDCRFSVEYQVVLLQQLVLVVVLLIKSSK